jgi:hypothetical protein
MTELTQSDIYTLLCACQHEDFFVVKSSDDQRDNEGLWNISVTYKNTQYIIYSFLDIPILHRAVEQFGLISLYAADCGRYVEKYLNPLILEPGIKADKFAEAWELINPDTYADIVESTIIPQSWDIDILFELYINELIFFNKYDTSTGHRTQHMCPILITNDVFFPVADGYTIPIGQEQVILDMYNRFSYQGINAWASKYTGFTPRKITEQYNDAIAYLSGIVEI